MTDIGEPVKEWEIIPLMEPTEKPIQEPVPKEPTEPEKVPA